MSSNNYNPNNPASGPDFEDIDFKHPFQKGDEIRPEAVTYRYDMEDIPHELFEQIAEKCFVEITCPKCGNTCFFFLPKFGAKGCACQVDGCDAVFELD